MRSYDGTSMRTSEQAPIEDESRIAWAGVSRIESICGAASLGLRHWDGEEGLWYE